MTHPTNEALEALDRLQSGFELAEDGETYLYDTIRAALSANPSPPSQGETEGVQRKCLTPETYYSFGLAGPKTLVVHLRFPFNVEYWALGTALIEPGEEPSENGPSNEEKLRRYTLQAKEKARLSDLIHDAMEPIGADAYRVMAEVDARMGTNHVETAITRARSSSPTPVLPVEPPAIGKWLSAALDDPNVCDEMKADIRTWFDAGEPPHGPIPVEPVGWYQSTRVLIYNELAKAYCNGCKDAIANYLMDRDPDFSEATYDYAKAQTEAVMLSLATPTPAIGWKPIETAPKDGTVIWLCSAERMELGLWASGPGIKSEWWSLHGLKVAGNVLDLNLNVSARTELDFEPSHWQETPALLPPSPEQGGE